MFTRIKGHRSVVIDRRLHNDPWALGQSSGFVFGGAILAEQNVWSDSQGLAEQVLLLDSDAAC
jgi:hypothetical protein